jgi:hypothetical protein
MFAMLSGEAWVVQHLQLWAWRWEEERPAQGWGGAPTHEGQSVDAAAEVLGQQLQPHQAVLEGQQVGAEVHWCLALQWGLLQERGGQQQGTLLYLHGPVRLLAGVSLAEDLELSWQAWEWRP